jgi:hypothetical protein
MSIPSALIGAGSSILGGLLSGGGNRETKMQRTQRHLVDKLLASLSGKGEYADLFKADENAFNKSFVEPAQARFRNQIAPEIQQQYIASGQQRSSGLDDALLKAGVDLDMLLNQNYLEFQNQAKNRQQNVLGSILQSGSGAQPQPSFGQNLSNAVGGYLASPEFSKMANSFINPSQQSNTTAPSNAPNAIPPRRGYLPDYQLGDARWGQV